MNAADFTHTAYNQLLNQHKLMASQCESCGKRYLPPRSLCPACYGEKMTWVPLSGKGELTAFTIVHIAPTAMIEAGYGRDKPYCAGIVRLAEGPSISAQILGVDPARPEGIALGTPLQATFVQRVEGEGGRTHLAFETLR
jgi:uncharacterized OB-fold protein